MPVMHGIWIIILNLQWMLCVVRLRIRWLMFFLVVNGDVLLCAACFCKSLIFCFWTNLQTIWMPKLLPGLKNICMTTQVLLLLLLMTAIFLMMLQAGFWSLTVEKVILLRVTIQAGLNKRKTGLLLKKRVKVSGARKCSENWNGFTWVQKAGRLSTRNILPVMKNCFLRVEKLS